MGMQYGRYKILSQLGQGGMAAVYLAEDPALNRLVAIKVIQSHLSSDSGLLQRFSAEAKTIAAIRHANIVEIFDFGVQNGQQYIVMEYMDGQTMQVICSLHQGKPLPEEITAVMICQAAEGLIAAEKKGVIHRDIKPENLMINSEGYLKIADFGIAHLSNEQSLTATGAVLGSPNFMSPEQVEGNKPSHQTDMWALGGILYYSLTGKLPFTGPTITSTLRNICDHSPEPISTLNLNCSPELIFLAETLLQKEPENRGEGARWVASELRKFLTVRGITDLQETTKSFVGEMNVPQSNTIMEMTPPPGASSSKIPLTPGARINFGDAQTTPSTKGGTWQPGLTPSNSGVYNPSGVTTLVQPAYKNPVLWVGIFILIALLGVGGLIYMQMQGKEKGKPSGGIQKVILETNQLKIPIGESKILNVTILPTTAAADLEWSSTNESIASVEDGKITGKKLGTTIIIAKSKMDPEKDAICRVSVIKKPVEVARPEPEPKPVIRTPKSVKQPRPVIRKDPEPKKPDPPKEEPKPEPQAGKIKILSSPPFATIRVNGVSWGETPMNRYREVPSGKVRIELVHRLYPPLDTAINLKAGSEKSYKFRLN